LAQEVKLDTPTRHAAALLPALAFALGMIRIGHKSLWFDEAVSAYFAGRPLRALLPVITGSDPNMALYYVLLNLWRRVFGSGEVALRSLSALAGAVAVAAVYTLGTRLFGKRTGTFAALLLALNPFMIEYAQMARGYTLVACMVTISCWLFVIELERPTLGTRVAYVLVSALAVYVHYFAALVLLAQLVMLVALRHRYPMNRPRLTVLVVVVLVCLPAVMFARAGGTARISWIPPLSLLSVRIALVKLAGRSLLAVVNGVAVAWAVYRLAVRARSSGHTEREWRLEFITVWLAVPFIVAFVVSFWRPLFMAQYLIVCLPAFCLITGTALARIAPARRGTILLAVCAALSVPRLVSNYRVDGEEDWRGAERYVASQSHGDERVTFYPDWSGMPFDYYAELNGRPRSRIRADDSAQVGSHRVWFVLRDADAVRSPAEVARDRALVRGARMLTQRVHFASITVEAFDVAGGRR
jgi:mannosyltransferase